MSKVYKGIRSSSNIIQQMSYNPIHQQEMALYDQAEGADNRAVSMRDKHIGKMVAKEQERGLESARIGDEFAMRKDRLAHAKKISDQRAKLSQDSLQLGRDRLKHQKKMDKFSYNLGLISTGISAGNMAKNYFEDREYRKELNDYQNYMYEKTGYAAYKRALETDDDYELDAGYQKQDGFFKRLFR